MPVALLLAVLSAAPVPDPSFLRSVSETKSFMRGRPMGIRVTPDGKAVLYLESPPRSPALSLYVYDVAAGKAEVLITPDEVLKGKQEVLSVEERARRERLRMTERGFTAFDLCALTRGGTADLMHGVAEFVAQEELDRFTGFWWSPDSQAIAYTEVDQRGVEHVTIADPAHPEQPAEVFAYPRPGKENAAGDPRHQRRQRLLLPLAQAHGRAVSRGPAGRILAARRLHARGRRSAHQGAALRPDDRLPRGWPEARDRKARGDRTEKRREKD